MAQRRRITRNDRGLTPRSTILPYGRQTLDASDRQAVLDVLESDWLTTGPQIALFEAELAAAVQASHAVVVGNGTQALQLALQCLDVGPGDEVIVPAITFVATANAALYCGATPRFADVDADTLLVDPASVEALINEKTRAVIAVDYAGQPCCYDQLAALCGKRNLVLLSDACHSLGASYQGRPVGSLARLSTLSFHPVKPITTAEGGAIVTDDEALASKMRVLRNHGITTDFRQRELRGTHDYDMTMLGHNFRLSDLQCALGRNQLAKLPSFIEARQKIAEGYDRALQGFRYLRPLKRRDDCAHAYHLYVVRLDLADSGLTREQIYQQLRDEHIGVAVHYKPVYLHSYYREKLGYGAGLCPTAEAAYATILSFPIYPSMSEADQLDVLAAFERVEERIERGSVG